MNRSRRILLFASLSPAVSASAAVVAVFFVVVFNLYDLAKRSRNIVGQLLGIAARAADKRYPDAVYIHLDRNL